MRLSIFCYLGKGKKPTIVLEAVADHDLWIWHAFFGMPGSCNDINVLDNSPLLNDLFTGRFPPAIEYELNGVTRTRGYFLADGIYPKWGIFVQSFKEPANLKQAHFTKRQEAVRKDVERAFGVLQGRFHILARPSRLWTEECMGTIMRCCIILHNMVVEYRRDEDQSTEIGDGAAFLANTEASTAPSLESLEGQPESATNIIIDDEVPQETALGTMLRGMKGVMDSTESIKLRDDIVEHLWKQRG